MPHDPAPDAAAEAPTRGPEPELGALPAFSSLRPEAIEAMLDELLARNRAAIDTLLESGEAVSWEDTLLPLEELQDALNKAWSPVGHLHGVSDNEALRTAYNACLPKLADYYTGLGQDERLYRAYRHIAESPEFERLGAAEAQIVRHALRDFRLSGIELDEAGRARYREIRQELSRLQTRFEENLLDATHGWKLPVTEAARLAGLPESALDLARQQAAAEGLEGWLFTLDFPSYMPVMMYAEDRALREEMYTAYCTRASDQGPNAGKWDNGPLMSGILDLRQEMARLVGYPDFASYSLATKMARDTDEVVGFLRDMAARSKPVAEQEMEALRRFALERHGVQSLEAWDIAYYGEQLRQHRYALSQEELRPYFPAPRVVQGLFDVVQRLYGLKVTEVQGVDVWHPDVRFYEVRDAAGALRGRFYLDLYARAHKRGGAWMDECVNRKRTAAGLQTPVAYLTCNFSPPVGGRPALLTHNEVITLFHEFGHGLHHLLTQIDRPGVSGINGVAWDAVELPSQFMENWCWEREALALISAHVDTGEPIPEPLFERMLAARNFQAGMQMVRQLEFALFDFQLHMQWAGGGPEAVQAVLEQVRQECAVIQPPDFNRFQHSFGHIFSGGYAAGYYSYKWAEVLSADAFSLFEERGVFDAEAGRRFLQGILEQGGAREPMDLFVAFRGRPPSIDALLRHSGIAA